MSCLFLLLHLKLYGHHFATISWFMLVFFQTGIMCQVSQALLLLALDSWLDSQSAGNYLGYSIQKAFFNMTITIIIIKTLYWLMYHLLISNNVHAYTIMLTFIALNVSEDLPAYNFSCVHFSPDNMYSKFHYMKIQTQHFTKLKGKEKIYTEIHKFRSFYGNWMQKSLLGWPVMVSSIWLTVFNEIGQETEQ